MILRPLELLRALIDNDVSFIVIGGFSLAAHGLQRATKDIDIVPQPDPRNLDRLWQSLEAISAEPIRPGDFNEDELPVDWTVEGLQQGGNWILETTLGRLDILQDVAGVDGYSDLRAEAVDRDLPGVGVVWFAGRDDLISMKRAAGRPRDMEDIAQLEAQDRE